VENPDLVGHEKFLPVSPHAEEIEANNRNGLTTRCLAGERPESPAEAIDLIGSGPSSEGDRGPLSIVLANLCSS